MPTALRPALKEDRRYVRTSCLCAPAAIPRHDLGPRARSRGQRRTKERSEGCTFCLRSPSPHAQQTCSPLADVNKGEKPYEESSSAPARRTKYHAPQLRPPIHLPYPRNSAAEFEPKLHHRRRPGASHDVTERKIRKMALQIPQLPAPSPCGWCSCHVMPARPPNREEAPHNAGIVGPGSSKLEDPVRIRPVGPDGAARSIFAVRMSLRVCRSGEDAGLFSPRPIGPRTLAP